MLFEEEPFNGYLADLFVNSQSVIATIIESARSKANSAPALLTFLYGDNALVTVLSHFHTLSRRERWTFERNFYVITSVLCLSRIGEKNAEIFGKSQRISLIENWPVWEMHRRMNRPSKFQTIRGKKSVNEELSYWKMTFCRVHRVITTFDRTVSVKGWITLLNYPNIDSLPYSPPRSEKMDKVMKIIVAS